jgi:predicted RNase H-like HicB family nuclease
MRIIEVSTTPAGSFISDEETHYTAECAEYNIVAQGKTWEEAIQNIFKAIWLQLTDEELVAAKRGELIIEVEQSIE